MQNHAFKTGEFINDAGEHPAQMKNTNYLYLASVIAQTPSDIHYGPDLGAFEEQYLLGYACFA